MATKAKKYKKLTNAEKKINKEVKAELREKGFIPPVKARLNRKKFLDEVKALLESDEMDFDMFMIYLRRAIIWMIPDTKFQRNITSEHIGAAKTVKMAFEMFRFENELRAKGERTYNPTDLYERIKPIIDL